MKKLLFGLALSLASLSLFAQEPMVAYRIEGKWHFYGTDNKLLFPVNEFVGPGWVSTFCGNYARVYAPTFEKGQTKITNGLLNRKGVIERTVPSGYAIVGYFEYNKKQYLSCLYHETANEVILRPGNKIIPNQLMGYFRRLTARYSVSAGLAKNMEEYNSILPDDTEQTFFIWDVEKDDAVARIQAQNIVAADDKGVFLARKNGKWGLVNLKGQWIATPTYEDIAMEDDEMKINHIGFSKQGLVIVKQGQNYGLLNLKGKLVVPAKYKELYYLADSDAYLAKQGDTYGTLNGLGQAQGDFDIFEPQKPNAQGIMIARGEDFTGLRNLKGEWLIKSPDGHAQETFQDLGQGLFLGSNDLEGKALRFCDAKGKTIKQLDAKISLVAAFHHDLAACQCEDGKIGYLDTKGNWAIPCQFELPKFSDEDEPLPSASKGYIYFNTGKSHVFYDHKGKLIREDFYDGDDVNWEMMRPLQERGGCFWTPYE